MKVVSTLALGVALSLLCVEALRVEKRDSPAVLSLPLLKKTPGPSSKRSLRKRQGEVETPDINYQTNLLYLVQLQIGTPPQSTYVQLDTGSSDLVVETPSSDICSASPPNPCTEYGSCMAVPLHHIERVG
jgi:Eukaryotic aspartyl protease